MSAPAVSVLLPADGDVAVTLRGLQALARLPEETAFEVVVVVPAADAANRSLLDGLEGDVRVVVEEAPSGVGDAFDRAAVAASAPLLVALDPAARPADGWLGALTAALGDGAAALPRGLTPEGVDVPEASWPALAVTRDAYFAVGGFAGTRAYGQAEKATLLDALRAGGHAVATAPDAILLVG